MKKLLYTTALIVILASTPTLAWQQKYTINNNTIHWPPDLVITEISLTVPGGSTISFPLPDIGPKQSSNFTFFKDPPCLRWLTIASEYKPPFTASTQFNVCTQTTIIITQNSTGQYVFTYN